MSSSQRWKTVNTKRRITSISPTRHSWSTWSTFAPASSYSLSSADGRLACPLLPAAAKYVACSLGSTSIIIIFVMSGNEVGFNDFSLCKFHSCIFSVNVLN